MEKKILLLLSSLCFVIDLQRKIKVQNILFFPHSFRSNSFFISIIPFLSDSFSFVEFYVLLLYPNNAPLFCFTIFLGSLVQQTAINTIKYTFCSNSDIGHSILHNTNIFYSVIKHPFHGALMI